MRKKLTKTEQVVRLLRAAKKKIQTPTHWMRGAYNNGKGRYCAIGAVDAVITARDPDAFPDDHPLYAKVCGRLNTAARKVAKDRTIGIIDLNDDTNFTHKHVLRAFNLAIKAATAKINRNTKGA